MTPHPALPLACAPATLVELARRRREDLLYPNIDAPLELALSMPVIRELERFIDDLETCTDANAHNR